MVGGSEEIGLRESRGRDVIPPECPPEAGVGEPIVEEEIVEGFLFFIPERCAEDSTARVAGEGNTPRRLDHSRVGVVSGGGSSVANGRLEGKQTEDQERHDLHFREHPSPSRHPWAIDPIRPPLYHPVKPIQQEFVE
jgi:hypothetical protein